MTLRNVVDIYCPNWSLGLSVDATVLAEAIDTITSGRVRCRTFHVPEGFYFGVQGDLPQPPELSDIGEIAIFIERVFHLPVFEGYASRAMLANPEWVLPEAMPLIERLIDVFIHKTALSLSRVGARFPGAAHVLTGFTSPDPGVTVTDYAAFAHFRGKSTTRHSQVVVDLWRRRPDLPPLYVQSYAREMSLQVGRWLSSGNLNLYLDFYPSHAAYFADLSRAGIHLCTSEIEGFGHYLNESRAMSALVLTLDAPPMNELITADTGILIPAVETGPVNLGVRFRADESAIEQAVETALGLRIEARRAFGQAAREAYEQGRRSFLAGLREFLASRDMPP